MTAGKDVPTAEGDPLRGHVAECAACQKEPPEVLGVSNVLRESIADLPLSPLSQATLLRLRPELARQAAAAFRRRVTMGLLAALIPLPLVLLFDAYVLRALFDIAVLLIPTTLAAYIVISYGVCWLLLMALVYGSIPLLVERQVGGPATMTT